MKYIKSILLIAIGVLLLDSCIVITRRPPIGRRGFFLHPQRGYRKLPNYHPQPKKYYNPIPNDNRGKF
jgi:hypothetical protein